MYPKFRLREPFKKPLLSSEPSISVQPLQPQDQFLIFASDGLWEHLNNQEAVDIVHNNPRSVCSLSQNYISILFFYSYGDTFMLNYDDLALRLKS